MESTTDPRASALLPASGGERFDQAMRVVCLLAAVAVAIPGVLLSALVWERSPFYSHGYVIPAVFAYLLYSRRDMILEALRMNDWVQKDAAKFLGMSRRVIHYKIQKLGITNEKWRKNRKILPKEEGGEENGEEKKGTDET